MIRRDRNRRIKFSALGLRISHSFPNGLHRFRSYKFSRVQIVESKIRGDRYNTSKFECILSLSRILSRNAKRVRSQFVVDEKARLEIRSAGQKESFRCDVQRKYFFSYRSLGPPPPPHRSMFHVTRGGKRAFFLSFFLRGGRANGFPPRHDRRDRSGSYLYSACNDSFTRRCAACTALINPSTKHH